MTDLFPSWLLDRDLLRRAFESADHGGEAALNGLLYGSAAMLASSVLLVTTDPPVLGVILATIPWIGLAAGGWLWIGPAVRTELDIAHHAGLEADFLRAAAADLLLDDTTTDEDRRLAASYLSGPLDDEQRATLARWLLQRSVDV